MRKKCRICDRTIFGSLEGDNLCLDCRTRENHLNEGEVEQRV